jgi:hypothetical protein
MTLHIRQLDGINSHHIIEATFKAFARAMRMATGEWILRRAHEIPSSRRIVMNEPLINEPGMNETAQKAFYMSRSCIREVIGQVQSEVGRSVSRSPGWWRA